MTYFSEEGAKNAARLVAGEFNEIYGISGVKDISNQSIKYRKYRIRNIQSGLYLDVTDGKAANGVNVQQWASDRPADYNTWRLKSQGNRYYKIYLEVGNKSYYQILIMEKLIIEQT